MGRGGEGHDDGGGGKVGRGRAEDEGQMKGRRDEVMKRMRKKEKKGVTLIFFTRPPLLFLPISLFTLFVCPFTSHSLILPLLSSLIITSPSPSHSPFSLLFLLAFHSSSLFSSPLYLWPSLPSLSHPFLPSPWLLTPPPVSPSVPLNLLSHLPSLLSA